MLASNPAWMLNHITPDLGIPDSVKSRHALEAATRLAVELDHPAYDCLYLAMAVERDCPFVTADDRFLRKLASRSRRALRGKAISLTGAARM